MTCRRIACAVLVFVTVASGVSRAAQAATSTPIFRVFLKSGAALACWGEYARVGDRLVLTVPIGEGARTTYEFVSLPVSRVDMVKTERYAEAVRAAQFAASRGETEYAALRDRLAAQLASIEAQPNAKDRLATAESARQQLIDWAGESHGYRAKEVQQLLQLFDSAIIDLRVAAGESRFSINLSTEFMPSAPVRLRPAPTSRESIELALQAASAADADEARTSLLRRARSAAAALPADDPGTISLREAIDRALSATIRVESAYRRLDRDVRRLAAEAVDRGDVLAIEALRGRVRSTDRQLGLQRPDDVAALFEELDRAHDAAAQQRLVLDHWESTRDGLVAYARDTAGAISTLDGLSATLTEIEQMSGPPVTTLVTAERQTADVVSNFATVVVPEGMLVAHSLLGLAIEQADIAVRTRHRAVEAERLSLAREASAAAADARERLVQAKAALAAAMQPPKAIR